MTLVPHVNDCSYCEAAYTGAAKMAGHSDDDALVIRRGEVPGDEKLTAMLKVCREIATHQSYVEDSTWKGRHRGRLDRAGDLEAYADVIRTILTNFFNHLVGTELDRGEAPPLD